VSTSAPPQTLLVPSYGKPRGSATSGPGTPPQQQARSSALMLPSDHYLEAEPERPVCRQVVAGPRFEPATDSRNGDLPRVDLWITAPKVSRLTNPGEYWGDDEVRFVYFCPAFETLSPIGTQSRLLRCLGCRVAARKEPMTTPPPQSVIGCSAQLPQGSNEGN